MSGVTLPTWPKTWERAEPPNAFRPVLVVSNLLHQVEALQSKVFDRQPDFRQCALTLGTDSEDYMKSQLISDRLTLSEVNEEYT